MRKILLENQKKSVGVIVTYKKEIDIGRGKERGEQMTEIENEDTITVQTETLVIDVTETIEDVEMTNGTIEIIQQIEEMIVPAITTEGGAVVANHSITKTPDGVKMAMLPPNGKKRNRLKNKNQISRYQAN